jgi:3-phenylpropionate/cinnamic acid dioxygenase small subunit
MTHRQAIEDVLLAYATALDCRDWAALEGVFAADAVADYCGIGVFEGRQAIVGVVADFLGHCGATQHMITNVRVDLPDQGEARTRCYLQAIHAGKGAYSGKIMTVWGEYADRLEQRPEGWRIVHRALQVLLVTGDVGVALKGNPE